MGLLLFKKTQKQIYFFRSDTQRLVAGLVPVFGYTPRPRHALSLAGAAGCRRTRG
jgi:hypothetical protein